ncbi:Rha family transcriptional regulator [Nitrosococcus wardiae]|uniref:Rha family transcriptional regulator n=1 Tax=Nitrosococcus wardiae TaxID=1814290 RepID=A0A4P7C0M6_9GAMM|nr:Rha family transcriptional regulator [Nitrosococcus wardiae]QBQ54944.1 hypothetical protein E3U44_10765 [Nitrosococcus wardiae]
MQNLVNLEVLDQQLTMSSVEIAEVCGKQHKNVLADIRALEEQGVIDGLKFKRNYKDSLNREKPCYHLPKRETLILTSGYSAKQRAAIIDRWLYLEEQKNKNLSPAEQLLMQAQMLVKSERRIAALEERQRITEGKLEDFATGAEHFSITAYHKLFLAQQISNNQANSDGRKLSHIAKNQGIKLGRAPHPVWGTVNTYPKALLDAYYRGEYQTH